MFDSFWTCVSTLKGFIIVMSSFIAVSGISYLKKNHKLNMFICVILVVYAYIEH